MKRLFTILTLLTSAYTYTHAQTDAVCIQALRTARATYEQGRLHELPSLLEDCLPQFSQTEKVEAYKLLVLTYIYLEEPEKADDAMLQLLRTDHFFEINEGTDPTEFRNLYNKFRTKPVFSLGARVSVLTTGVNVQEYYYIFANGKGNGTYTSNPRIGFGVTFEKNILKGNLTLTPELFFTGRSFTYSNNKIFSTDNQSEPSEVNAIINQNLIQLNTLVQYRFKKTIFRRLVSPYVGGGFSTGYLRASEFTEGELIIEPTGNGTSGVSLNNLDNYKSINFSAVALVGGRVKAGPVYFTADFRYYLGLHNVVNKKNRNANVGDNIEILSRYGYVNSDFSINQAAFSIGIIYPYFNPKKLIK